MTGSHPGLTGWTGSRVDRVSPGQFPSGFLPPPGPVPGPGRPGPGSTRRAGPGFKTLESPIAKRMNVGEKSSMAKLKKKREKLRIKK